MVLIDKIRCALVGIKKEDLKTLKKNKINISISSSNILIKEMKFKERSIPKPSLEKEERKVIKEAKQKVKDAGDLMTISVLLHRLREELQKAQFIGLNIQNTIQVESEFADINKLFGQKLLEMKND